MKTIFSGILVCLTMLFNETRAENDEISAIDIVAVFGFGGDPGKAVAQTYLESAKTSKSGKVYMINGKDKNGDDKTYSVLLGDSQADLQHGLSTPSCVVVYDGHSNMGLGPSFDSASIKRLSDFTNISNPQTAINWLYWVGDEYPGLTTIEENEIAGTVTNYEVPNLDKVDKLRYPNTNGVVKDGTFTKTGTGMGQKHFDRGADNHYLIVNGGSADLPALKYDAFFYNSCNSGRDYIEVFTNKTFFHTVDECSSSQTSKIFIENVIAGKTWTEVLQAINAVENLNKVITR
jgi:hypothetical protein